MQKQISFKTDNEAAELFDKLYGIAIIDNPALTKGAFFEAVVNSFANPKLKQIEVSDPQQEIFIQELKKVDEEKSQKIHELNQEIDDCLKLSEMELNFVITLRTLLNLTDDADGEMIIKEIRATQQRAMNALIDVKPVENQLSFIVDEPHLSLLKETVIRLSAKYNKTVTMKMVLMDMFARYTVDQLNEWFYPFMINGDEDFKSVTGLTQKELKRCLKTV